jgi:thiol-disulfide isomerase/thioredoxin
MVLTTRRAALTGIGVLAAATVAVVATMRKPAPVMNTPADGAGDERVSLQGAGALKIVEHPAPVVAFSFNDAAGGSRQIGDFVGRGVVVNLWATWCVPCVAELPALAAFARQVAAEGIVVLPLSSDRGGAPIVEKYFRSHGLTGLDVLLDPQGAAARALGARGVPTTVVIDRQGRERARLEGAADWTAADMLAALRKLVG